MAKLNDAVQRFLSGNNPRMKVNLKKIFDVDLRKFPGLKQAIGQEILDVITDRTRRGSKDWQGNSFKKYSKAYKKSLDFNAFGKTNKVNLTLTGDMLDLMDFDDEGNVLKLGWDDRDEAGKAHGNITGSYGQKSPNAKNARDFFGLNEKEIDSIKSKFSERVTRQAGETETSSAVQQALAFLERLRRRESEGGGDGQE